MPCERHESPAGVVIVCSRGRTPAPKRRKSDWCLFCLRNGRKTQRLKLCDAPADGAEGTCDKPMCADHVARHEAPDTDWCPDCAQGEAGR